MKKLLILTLGFIFLIGVLPLINSALTDDLQFYYAFEEGAGNFLDQVSSNDLVEAGTVGRVSGKIGSGTEYNDNGANHLESEANVGITGADPRTTCWWSEQDGTGSHDSFIGWGTYLGFQWWQMLYYSSATYYLQVSLHTEDVRTNVITTTNFDFYCVLFNGTTINWYRNAVSISNKTVSGTVNTADAHLIIGVADTGGLSWPMDGIIDEVGIWNRTLTGAEVVQLYNSNSGLTYPFILPIPTITTLLPANNTVIGKTGIYFNATYNTSTTDWNWTNATYHIWLENGTLFNSTTINITGQNNFTSQYIDDFTLGTYIWNVKGYYDNTTFNNYTWATLGNFTLVVGATIINESYDPFVYETEHTSFIMNISLLPGAIIYDQSLIYNGTSYSGDLTDLGSDDYTLSLNMDVPLLNGTVSENRTLFWSIIFLRNDGSFSYQNLTSSQQNVSAIGLTSCTSGTITLNFTTWNEEDITRLMPYNFYGTFEYWFGSGTEYKSLYLSNETINETLLCLDLNETYNINAHIQYEKDLFVKRNYYLINATLNNVTEHINLFFLNSSQSTSFIVEVKDQNQLPIEQAYLYFQRYYPGTGNFETVEMGRTDTTGSTVGHFEAETEDYKVIVFKDGEVLFESGTQKIFCRETPCTITFQIQALVGTEWSAFGDIANLIWSLDFNETTKMWTYVYVDTSGITQYGRLYVFYEKGTGGVSICNTNSTSSSATLTCNVTGYEGKTIYAAAYISRSPELLVYLKSVVVEGLKSIFGLEGLVLSMFILLLLGLAGLWNPAVGIILIIVGMVTLNLIGLASFGAVTIWGVIFIALLLLWELKT